MIPNHRTPTIIFLYLVSARILRSLIAYARKFAQEYRRTRKPDEKGNDKRNIVFPKHSKHHLSTHSTTMNIPVFNPRFKAKQLFSKYSKNKEKGISLGGSWWIFKNNYLKQHPYCAKCSALGEEVHHIQPRSTHPHLMWDWQNLQTLCKKCHIDTHRGERA